MTDAQVNPPESWFGRVLAVVATRVKGEPFDVDPAITAGYLAHTVGVRTVMAARGRSRFPVRAAAPFIGPGVQLRAKHLLRTGAGTSIAAGATIDAMSREGVVLGANVSVGRNTRIECTGSLRHLGRGMTVGDNVGLGTDCFYGCAGGISIGSDTIVGNRVTFHSENHVIADLSVPIRSQGVEHQGIRVGRDCWIGARVAVLDGAKIGDGCVFAAGSVVTAGTYGDHGIYGGVPAKLLKTRQ